MIKRQRTTTFTEAGNHPADFLVLSHYRSQHSLGALLTDVIRGMEERLIQAGATLFIKDDLPLLEVNAAQLQQVVRNIFSWILDHAAARPSPVIHIDCQLIPTLESIDDAVAMICISGNVSPGRGIRRWLNKWFPDKWKASLAANNSLGICQKIAGFNDWPFEIRKQKKGMQFLLAIPFLRRRDE
ncbi:MAG TPA: hypothetical protein VHK91_12735 [Flavisolibacter sp.]|jgi:hypothetical protein|nr:hypothetical protein [Flavisolibacter sp.]